MGSNKKTDIDWTFGEYQHASAQESVCANVHLHRLNRHDKLQSCDQGLASLELVVRVFVGLKVLI